MAAVVDDRAVCCGHHRVCESCEVRDLAVCRVLSPEELRRFAALARHVTLESGATLFHEGDPATHVYSLTRGYLRLCKLLADGRRQITGFLVPGDFIGLAFADTYVYSAEALGPTRLCAFARTAFQDWLARTPHLEHELLGRARGELAAAQEQMLLLGRKSARERVASFLLAFARRLGREPGETVPLPMTRTDIADYLGLTIETVSRTLSGLRREGLIELVGKNGYRIRHAAALEAVAAL